MRVYQPVLRVIALMVAMALLVVVAGCGGEAVGPSDGDKPTDSSGNGTQYNTWDDTFWVAATVGLGAINTEAQMKRVVKNHAEAGVNMVLWHAGDSYFCDQFLQECETYDIYTILFGGDTAFHGASENWSPITESEFKEAIEPLAKNPRVVGFINWDEPFHEEQYYTMMKERQDWTEKYAPGKLSFINLVPSYGLYTWGNGQWPEHVDALVEKVGPSVMSVDYYEFAISGPNPNWSRSFLWRDLGYLRKASIEQDVPLWFYFQGSDYSGLNQGDLSPDQLALQMNAALAYGSRWLCYWTSEGSVVDKRGYKSDIYEEVTALNKRVMAIGTYLFDKDLGELYHAGLATSETANKALADTFYCDDVADSDVFAALPASHLILTTFVDDTRTYVAVVNRSLNEAVNDTIPLLDSYDVKRFDPDTGTEQAVGEGQNVLSVSLDAAAIEIFILE